jgi:hypothetical protein
METPMTTPESQILPVEPPPPQPEKAPPAAPNQTTAALPKRALFAGFLSLFPGAGNVYNGLYLRGVTFFVLAAGSIYMVNQRGGLWGFVVAFVWIFNVLDAWRQANLINYGYSADLGLTEKVRPVTQGNGGIIGGIALLVVGLVAAMEIYLEIDVDWILDLWPFYLMLIGAWFIFSSLQAKRDEKQELED